MLLSVSHPGCPLEARVAIISICRVPVPNTFLGLKHCLIKFKFMQVMQLTASGYEVAAVDFQGSENTPTKLCELTNENAVSLLRQN